MSEISVTTSRTHTKASDNKMVLFYTNDKFDNVHDVILPNLRLEAFLARASLNSLTAKPKPLFLIFLNWTLDSKLGLS